MTEPLLVEIRDEREPLADAAFAVIEQIFDVADRQPTGELRSELAERRLGMLTTYSFHVIAALIEPDPQPAGVAVGLYLDSINAGFVSYLAVRREYRGRRIARLLRPRLVEVFRTDAHGAGEADLAFVLGEVRADNPWLRRLVRTRGAIPFDVDYYHPGIGPGSGERYLLYRQPLADSRLDLPVQLVRRILYAVWRRAYRVRYPLQRPAFTDMLRQIEERDVVGVHPDFSELLADFRRTARNATEHATQAEAGPSGDTRGRTA